jgi:hypothetical protein
MSSTHIIVLPGDVALIPYVDEKRHLVCVPYSKENLHAMAEMLGIKRCWFHKDHYDVPKTKLDEMLWRCNIVSSREIVKIIRGERK